MMGRIALIVSMSCFGIACDAADDGADETATFRQVELNGPSLNGPSLNGPSLNSVRLNGPSLNGPSLNSIHFNGPSLNGPSLNGPSLNGTLFSAMVDVNGQPVEATGDDFIGSEWDVTLDGVDHILRIDNIVQADPNIPGSIEFDDIYEYTISTRLKAGGSWQPLCGGATAIPLHNYWDLETGDRIDDPDTITFACTNGVLAKCVLWGYRPWATSQKCKEKKNGKLVNCAQVSLVDYHQACTRMARADYCGDGTSWTVDGTAIDSLDNLTPPIESPTTDWTLEAEWNPDGAFCVDDIRNQALKAQGLWPTCFIKEKKNGTIKKKTIDNCGSLKKDRALMYSTFDPAPQ